MLRMMKSLPLILAMAAFGIFATSCGTDHAQMRFVHASPDAQNFDVTIDGKSFATGLSYGSVSPISGYTTVKAGTRALEVFDTGTTTNPRINSNISFTSGSDYTVLASGNVNPQPGTIAPVVVTDSKTAPTSGNVSVRVIHDSPSVTADGNSGPGHIDVYIVTPGADITNMSPNISSLAYQQASAYQTLTAGPLQVIATLTGDANKLPIANQTYPDLATGQVRTFVILDNAGGGSVSLTPLELSDLN